MCLFLRFSSLLFPVTWVEIHTKFSREETSCSKRTSLFVCAVGYAPLISCYSFSFGSASGAVCGHCESFISSFSVFFCFFLFIFFLLLLLLLFFCLLILCHFRIVHYYNFIFLLIFNLLQLFILYCVYEEHGSYLFIHLSDLKLKYKRAVTFQDVIDTCCLDLSRLMV